MTETSARDQLAKIVYRVNNPKYGDYGSHEETADAIIADGWRPPSTGGATESQWEAAYYQKLADFARETLRTSELTRECHDLRRQLAERNEETAEERYAEGDQVEIYTVGRWEPADVCRDYGGDRIEARSWGHMMHTCRREDVRAREVPRG